MQFRIADTFTDSLAKLTNQEQKAVKETAFDLQTNPSQPGLQMHRLERTKDPHFWSCRVNRDVRVIVHRTEQSLMLCYVDHHDAAYAWAERRKLERHPKTGAAQLVEVREVIREKEIVIPVHVVEEVAITEPESAEAKSAAPVYPFRSRTEDELLSWGVPADWVSEVHEASEDWLLEHYERLPAEAAEALLIVAAGEEPPVAAVADAGADPFDHPDAQRRFRVVEGRDELEQALDAPWEKWAVFLHPSQRALVERSFDGPARVAGSAGTGKTVVALHRAAEWARREQAARTLLTTYSEPLARQLAQKLRVLVGREPKVFERIDVHALPVVAERLSRGRLEPVETASDGEVRALVDAARERHELPFAANWTWHEWRDVVDAWNLTSWEAYRDVQRRGRRTRIGAQQREALWGAFRDVWSALEEQGRVTAAQRLHLLAAVLEDEERKPYEMVVADESQDLGVPELRFLAALGADRPNALFFAGDLGQRIFQPPFSWKSLGIDVRGRSFTLRVNYRTSHQIRRQADRLLPMVVEDVDGNEERRGGTTSMFNGPTPQVQLFDAPEGEEAGVAEWLRGVVGGKGDDVGAGADAELSTPRAASIEPEQIAVFVRSEAEIERAVAAVRAAGLEANVLDASRSIETAAVCVATMHLAKGMEFRAVAVIACDEDVLPHADRLETAGDPGELEENYTTERHLLYVACTRARERLWVSGVEPGSEFLEDLG